MNSQAQTLALTHLYTARAIALLGGVCALSVFFYATFLLLTVTHAAGQTAIERQINALAAHVSDMETQYLVATKDITPDKALAMGFVSPNQKQISTVASAEPLTLTLR